MILFSHLGFPGGTECAWQCWRCGFNSWVRKIPQRRIWQPTPLFLTRKFHGQRSRAGYGPWDHKSQTRLTAYIHTYTQGGISGDIFGVTNVAQQSSGSREMVIVARRGGDTTSSVATDAAYLRMYRTVFTTSHLTQKINRVDVEKPCRRLQCHEVKSLSRIRLFATLWTVAYQDPQSMGFSRQEYWSGLPFRHNIAQILHSIAFIPRNLSSSFRQMQ